MDPLLTSKPQGICSRTTSLEAVSAIPKPKRVCRNTTPGNANTSVEDLTNRTRQMSIELPRLEELLGGDEEDVDRASVQQMVQQMLQKTHRRSSSFPPHASLQSMDAISLFHSKDFWQSQDLLAQADNTASKSEREDTVRTGHTRNSNTNNPPLANNNNNNSNNRYSLLPYLQSKDFDGASLAKPANNRTPSNRSYYKSVDMLDKILLPSLGSRQNSLASSFANIFASRDGNFSTQEKDWLKSVDGAGVPPNINNLYLSNGSNAPSSLLTHLKSMDRFCARNMGMNYNSKDLGPQLGGIHNVPPPNTGATLDALQVFKSTDHWENLFASTDIKALNLAWHQSNDLASSQKKQQQNPDDYLASKDWASRLNPPETHSTFDRSIFQTAESKGNTSSNIQQHQPKKTSSMDRYMKMYHEGLNPNNVPKKAAATSSAMAWPHSTSTVQASSLFPPLPTNNNNGMATASSLFPPLPTNNNNGIVLAPLMTTSSKTKAKTKPASAKASKPKKKGSKSGSNKHEPEVKVFVEYTDLDVLCQRGTKSRLHPGNERYRTLVESKKPEYRQLGDKYLKTKFAEDLVKHIQSYGGRFLEKDSASGQWYMIADQLARRKAGQALRDDNTPEGRKAKREKYNKKNKEQS